MKRMKLGLMAMLALLAFAAVAATAAQALPELLSASFPNKFSGSGGVGNLNTTGGNNIECKSNTASGEQTTTTLGKVVIDFKECSKGCKTKGAAAKEIFIGEGENAHFVLVAESGETHTYGILGLPPFPVIECTALTVNVEGSIILSTTFKLNTKTLTVTISSAQSAAGVQSVKLCAEGEECGATAHFLKANFGTGLEEAALVGSDSVTFEKEVEPVN